MLWRNTIVLFCSKMSILTRATWRNIQEDGVRHIIMRTVDLLLFN
jgi:hypothetical protein